MSAIKAHLHTLAEQEGMSVEQYMNKLKEDQQTEREYEEYEFWKSVEDGSYFERGYDNE